MLKKSERPKEVIKLERPKEVIRTNERVPSKPHVDEDKESPPRKKKKVDDDLADENSSSKIPIPEEIFNHSCIGRQRIEALMAKQADIDRELNTSIKEWNIEFVRNKYLYGEYRRRYSIKAKQMVVLENELAECRSELANIMTSFSSQRQEADRVKEEMFEARDKASDAVKSLKALKSKMSALEEENRRLLSKEKTVASEIEIGLKAVEDFKKSTAFKSIIQDHLQKAHDHIFDVKMKKMEDQFIEEGFIRGFLKGIRAVHRKTGVNIDDLSPSQASEDPSPNAEGDVESVSTSIDGDDEDVEIV